MQKKDINVNQNRIDLNEQILFPIQAILGL